MKMCVQYSNTMSRRLPMWELAYGNDIEGITRLLDEGVYPTADEERDWVRRMMSGRSGWTGERVYLRCGFDALLTV